MKIKLIDKSSNLPNAWKSCGVSKKEWVDLCNGGEVDVKKIIPEMEHLVTSVNSTKSNNIKKGDK